MLILNLRRTIRFGKWRPVMVCGLDWFVDWTGLWTELVCGMDWFVDLTGLVCGLDSCCSKSHGTFFICFGVMQNGSVVGRSVGVWNLCLVVCESEFCDAECGPSAGVLTRYRSKVWVL
jgi:hypothetical protein